MWMGVIFVIELIVGLGLVSWLLVKGLGWIINKFQGRA